MLAFDGTQNAALHAGGLPGKAGDECVTSTEFAQTTFLSSAGRVATLGNLHCRRIDVRRQYDICHFFIHFCRK